MELSPTTSVQTEIRRRETDSGDIQQKFFLDEFSNLRREVETWSIRLGGRHTFSPSSLILGSFSFQNRRAHQTEGIAPASRDTKASQRAYGGEFQNIFRQGAFNLTSGVGYFDVDGRSRTIIGATRKARQDIRYLNAYTYADFSLMRDLTAVLGMSIDYLRGSPATVLHPKDSQINPKIGIMWNPFEGSLFRIATIRVLKRTLITNETLEPTQVAGFTQFFDDINGTKAWRYGAGFDQKITKNLFAGIELSKRNLQIPITSNSKVVRMEDGQEYLARNYLFWTPHPWVGIRTEHSFERFDKAPTGDDDFSVNTHRVPLGVSVFHPSGLSTFLTATYYHQSGSFRRAGLFHATSDDFWTADAGISYRLPKRFGLVTFGAANLFNKKFKYFDTDLNNPRIQPTRTIFFKATFALP